MPFTHGSTLINIFEGSNTKMGDIKLDHWYDLHLVLSILNSYEEDRLINIGRCVHKNSVFPPTIHSFSDALNSLNHAYQLNHLGGDIGAYFVDRINERDFLIRCENPYPAKFNLGLIQGLAEKYQEPVEVREVPNHPNWIECVYLT